MESPFVFGSDAHSTVRRRGGRPRRGGSMDSTATAMAASIRQTNVLRSRVSEIAGSISTLEDSSARSRLASETASPVLTPRLRLMVRMRAI